MGLGNEIARPLEIVTSDGTPVDIASNGANLLTMKDFNNSTNIAGMPTGQSAFGAIYVVSVSSATGVVSLYAGFDNRFTYAAPVYDQYGTAVTYSSLVAERWYELPPEAFTKPFIWLVPANNITANYWGALKS